MLTDITLFEGEHIETLGRGVGLIVSPSHTFGTDALLLADFASPKKTDIACDLGTGCGIIPFLWVRDGKCKSITAVEIQENAYNQALRSAQLNSCGKIRFVNEDLNCFKPEASGQFDLVTMNPPYKTAGAGIKSSAQSALLARHETACTIDGISACAARLLRFGGKMCICQRPERLFDVMTAMRAHKIEPKRVRFVSKNGSSAPWLVLIEGKAGAKNGLKVEKPLLIENENGSMSEELLRITEKYRVNG